MIKNIYVYDDKEFYSIRQLAEYVGINEKTLTARLRRGMSVEAACVKKRLGCTYYEDGGVEKPLVRICEEQHKNVWLVRNRLKYGYSLHEALNKPKKVSKQGKPIVVNGILYNSVAEAIRMLDMAEHEGTIRSRLRVGKSADEAFEF